MQFGPKNLTIGPRSCDRRETRRAHGTASTGTVKNSEKTKISGGVSDLEREFVKN
jgi:hypothetical protein